MENINPPDEEIDVMSLHYGVAFKKAFRQIDVFCEFVKDVAGIELNIEKVIEEYQYPQLIGNIDIQYDLFAEDVNNRVIVEIQHVMDAHFYDRFLYYHMLGIIEQVAKAPRYKPDREVYTIVVLTGAPKTIPVKFGVARVRLNPIADDADEPQAVVPLDKNHQLIFLNPKLANERTAPNIKCWLDLIADTLDEKVAPSKHITGMLQKIIREIKKDTITPAEYARIKFEQDCEATKANEREEGIQQGIRQGIRQVACNFLRSGLAIEVVAKNTGLSLDEIKKLLR